jgi:hypothetical protein
MNKQMSCLFSILYSGLFLFVTMSCTSLKTVTPSPSVILPTLTTGDKVQVLLTNNKKIKHMKLVSIDSSGLVGIQAGTMSTIRVDEIRGIQKLKSRDGTKLGLYVIGPGSIVNATLYNGTTLRRLKVKTADSEKITYLERAADQDYKVVRMSEIRKLQVRVPDTEKTVELAVIPVAIYVVYSIYHYNWGWKEPDLNGIFGFN